jgi:hypothetical protein
MTPVEPREKVQEKMHCPHCGTEQLRRSPRRGLIERLSTVVIDRWPYRCLLCNTRFFARRVSSEGERSLLKLATPETVRIANPETATQFRETTAASGRPYAPGEPI